MKKGYSRQHGNVGELLTMGLCVLALTVVMLGYVENIQLIEKKAEIGQLARCYLLKMETNGYLTPSDYEMLTVELEELGMEQIDYEGSSLEAVGYGENVILQIRGRLEEYEIYEKRVSTAKN